MTPYKNLSGRSGVRRFRTGRDFIEVDFGDGIYIYSYASAGKRNVETMKQLAFMGRGLSTYISQFVKTKFASKRVMH
jgi:hypothetical protein